MATAKPRIRWRWRNSKDLRVGVAKTEEAPQSQDGKEGLCPKSRSKTISPCPALRPDRDKSGDGSPPRSLSRADIRRAPRGGCRLPDAILHGKRSLRPRSRAVQRLATLNFE